MKKIALVLSIAAMMVPALASAQTHVRGYTRSDGTYVQPHMRSAPDSTPNNNWSTRPNVNPYTGVEGTREPQPSYNSSYNQQPRQQTCTSSWGC